MNKRYRPGNALVLRGFLNLSFWLPAILLSFSGFSIPSIAKESLPPLAGNPAPGDFDAMWRGFDPRAEPLEVEVLQEWEEDNVVLRVVRFRIGEFKGQKATMAAVYGFPKGGESLPALVQIHGGGQFADYKAPLYNAKRGYATISIAWAGRISAPGYRVNKDGVQRFWDNARDDPEYRLTTDWGKLDAYHAPCRNPKNAFAHVGPAEWTLDAVDSPRNNPWFLCTLGARRALTFLEQRAEVDPDKLGVYGHSMGGKLTVMAAAADDRVKAAAPSCGGISDRHSKFPLYRSTIQDDVNLRKITCPVMFLSPSNDFHARFHDLPTALEEIQTDTWRITSSPHHNHQDTAEYQVAGPLWFDQILKKTFTFPQTPQAIWNWRTTDGTPHISVQVDSAMPVLSVDVYYTQHGQPAGEENDRENTIHRYWHHVAPEKAGKTWEAALPISRLDKPLWAYANVTYALREPVTGAGYYYAPYTANSFVLSSPVLIAPPEQLKEAGAAANQLRSLVIEDFAEGWEKDWFSYRPEDWGKRTNKIYDERWHAPANARLALEVLCTKPNSLVIGIDHYATEVQLTGGETWQSVTVSKDQFLNALGAGGFNWAAIRQLRLESKLTLRLNNNGENQRRTFGGQWKGEDPQFRNLRWLPANGE